MLFGQKILAFCTSKVYQDRFSEFISGLNKELITHDWRVFVFCSATDLYKDSRNNQAGRNIFELINWDITDALLISEDDILDLGLKNKLSVKAKEHNIPIIILDGLQDDVYTIKFNHRAGFEQVVRHIIEDHKKTKVHFMAGTKDSWQSQERLETFKDVIKDNNIPYDDSIVSYGDFWDYPARIATQKIIDSGNVPEAIICANDSMATTVIAVLQENGYSVPDDVLVSGFDGIQAAFFSNPRITTAFCNMNELGKETARFIFQIKENNIPVCSKLVSTHMITSESCGCKPGITSNYMNFINFLKDSYNRYRVEDSSLSNMAAAIQECHSIGEIQKVIQNELLYNVICMIKDECTDINTNPSVSHTSSIYGNVQYVLLDSDVDKGEIITNRYIKTSDLIPRMEEVLARKIPLIFTPINNVNQALGYLCFCFNNYDNQNYAKINQIASWLGNAIAGYRSMQYSRQLQAQIETMYRFDSLTGLYNRNGFQKIYKQVLNNPEIDIVSLAMCDLDNLKFINDNYSHNEGDNAIDIVGKALSSAFPDGYYCRYGGDEIIGLYPYAVSSDELNKKIEDYLDTYNFESGKPYEVSTSVGVYTAKKASFEEMFGKADKLMYEQKLSKKRKRGEK